LELRGTAYLFTLATLSVSFVGFSALVMMLRQTLGGEMSKFDVLITRIFIQLGFMVAAGSMLPPLLALFFWPAELIWRVSSAVVAIPAFLFAVTYPARRRSVSGMQMPLAVWLDVLVLPFLASVLILNAAGVVIQPGPGPFGLALTGILILAGWAYLQALRMLLQRHSIATGKNLMEGAGEALRARLKR